MLNMKKTLLALLVLIIVQLACSFGNSKKVNALIQQGDQLVEEGKYTEAISIYNQALELDEESSYAYSGRGTANRHLGNNELALDDLTKAIGYNTKNYKAYYERGMVYYLTDDTSAALSDCQKSVSINSEYALGHLCLGYVYDDTGDFDAAYKEYSESIALDPSQSWAYAKRGRILYYYYDNRFQEAVDDLSQALKLRPNWDYAYYYRGMSFYFMKNYSSTIQDLEQVLSLSTDTYFINWSHAFLGDAYYEEGDFKTAIKHYNLAINNISSADDTAYLYANRGAAYDQLGDRENAIDNFTKYLELDKSNSEYAMGVCARLNYLTIWGSSNIISFFFTAIAPPCSRNQGYSNNEDYNTPLNDPVDDWYDSHCPGMSHDMCDAAVWAQEHPNNP